MYRHASLRLPCERCAVEQPTAAMALSSSGAGYVCWRCQLSAQIAEHERAPRHRHRREWLVIAAICVAIVLAFVLGSALLVFSALAHVC